MRYEWEYELLPVQADWTPKWHLKKRLPVTKESLWQYAETVAWITKIGDRKWYCQFVNHDGSHTFKSLKAAKAYALAIITLEQ